MRVLYLVGLDVGVCEGRKTGEKKPSELGENQQQIQATVTPGRNRTQATLLAGERQAIPPPQFLGLLFMREKTEVI